MKEIYLPLGQNAQGVVKIGNTVHRPLNSNSEYIHQLLQLLEQKQYPYSPRYLGIDENGREILTFIKGDIARGDIQWTNEQLIHITKMIKQFHDATEGCKLTEGKEVVCHNDLAPWNLVIQNSQPVAFIDFDDSKPGYRIYDFAYFLWTFLDLRNGTSVEEQVRRIKLLNKEYGEFNSKDLINAIIKQQKKILKKRRSLAKKAKSLEEREFSKGKIKEIEGEMKWVKKNLLT